MENMKFSRNLLALRKEKKLTQEDLANYLGITKAAVSKWEQNQSYPDITLLPLIASYFDISIDKLLGYEPMMEDKEVKILYKNIIKEFSTEKFEEVYKKCINYEKKYYTCYFLQLHLGLLYCNHANLAGDEEKIKSVYEHAANVFERIEKNCDDRSLAKEALSLKSWCNLVLGKCDEIISDLKSTNPVSIPVETILSKAYLIKGDNEKAIKTLQVFIFNSFIKGIEGMTEILMSYNNDEEKLDLYVDKICEIVNILNLKNEYPQTLLNSFATISLIYGSKGDKDNCLKYLQECIDLISNKKVFNIKENKNKIFNYLPEFIEEMSIGNILPRSEKLIIESFKELLETHPSFSIIRNDIQYYNLMKKLEIES